MGVSDYGKPVYYLTEDQGSRMRLGEHRGHSACGNSILFKHVRFTPGVLSCPTHGEVAWGDTFLRGDPKPKHCPILGFYR